MIPRLGDGNFVLVMLNTVDEISLENDSPSRGRKLEVRLSVLKDFITSLENDSPSRGRKLGTDPITRTLVIIV